MIRVLGKQDLLTFVRGLSFINSGAGRPRVMHQKTTSSHHSPQVELKSLGAFQPEDVLVTVMELGPTNAPEMDKSLILNKMLEIWQKQTSQSIAGFYFSHHGSESAFIDTCFLSRRPMADMDTTGGLSLPYTDLNLLDYHDIRYRPWPFVAATDSMEVLYMDGVLPHSRLDEVIKDLSRLSKDNNLFMIGGVVRVKDVIATPVNNNGISRYLEYGSFYDLAEIKRNLKLVRQINTRIEKIIPLRHDLFLDRIFLLKTAEGQELKLLIRNSALFILDETGNPIVQPPPNAFCCSRIQFFWASRMFLNSSRSSLSIS